MPTLSPYTGFPHNLFFTAIYHSLKKYTRLATCYAEPVLDQIITHFLLFCSNNDNNIIYKLISLAHLQCGCCVLVILVGVLVLVCSKTDES